MVEYDFVFVKRFDSILLLAINAKRQIDLRVFSLSNNFSKSEVFFEVSEYCNFGELGLPLDDAELGFAVQGDLA